MGPVVKNIFKFPERSSTLFALKKGASSVNLLLRKKPYNSR